MNEALRPLSISVHHDSWIRHQIRDLVLHLSAPLETAELLQVGLISLAQSVMHFDWDQDLASDELERLFITQARERIRADLVDEVRQMTHLSRLQRRRWTLVKLAREHLRLRLRIQGQFRDPSPEELSVATGLSVTEIEVLRRMAQLGPWQPTEGSHHLMELRSIKPASESQLRVAREDTETVMERVAPVLLVCPRDRLKILQRHFGVNCLLRGQPLLPPAAAQRPGWLHRLFQWGVMRGLDRRHGHGSAERTSAEELWPRRFNHLLQGEGQLDAKGKPQAG